MLDATHCCARSFLSLAILPLQLGSVMSRSTDNVASYGDMVSLGVRRDKYYEIETSSYAVTSFSICKMDETSDEQYCTTLLPCNYCLYRFLRKEKKSSEC
jgi:hypothetical protein